MRKEVSSAKENLFEYSTRRQRQKEAPLALRMRPESLEEFVGQEHIVGPGTLLRRAIEEDRVPSCLFAGPAGTGKTTLARLIARHTQSVFEQISAVASGVAEVRRLIEEARYRLTHYNRRTMVFIDEIHRFNKAQQDALLPSVEDGTIILVGATTENPYYAVNAALLSRCRIYQFESLSEASLREIIRRALSDDDRGIGYLKVSLTPEALEHLLRVADGDARSALSALEMAAQAAVPGDDGTRAVEVQTVVEAVQRRALTYDRDGDQHHDTISAFIKSMRGSDADAALYWLARMVYAGEDPRFIARRIVIAAAEDVGNADPRALSVAVAAAQACELVGLPEGRIPLAQAALYVATAPKSNSAVTGIDAALEDVRNETLTRVPGHLRSGARPAGAGGAERREYVYPHDSPGHHVNQPYLPEGRARGRYFRPSESGYEATLKERYLRWWPELRSVFGRPEEGPKPPGSKS